MLLAAIGAELIERRYYRAAFWSGLAALFTNLGMMHAYQLGSPNDGNLVDFYFQWFSLLGQDSGPSEKVLTFDAMGLSLSYALFGLIFFIVGWRTRNQERLSDSVPDGDGDES